MADTKLIDMRETGQNKMSPKKTVNIACYRHDGGFSCDDSHYVAGERSSDYCR